MTDETSQSFGSAANTDGQEAGGGSPAPEPSTPSETIGAYPREQVTVQGDETMPVDRCEVCGEPGEWTVSYTGFLGSRNPPYRFWNVTYCEEHLPDDGRAAIPEWAHK